jgi:hypothetical protein
MVAVLDNKMQRKMSLARCLENIAPFKEELVEQLGAAKCNIEDMCRAKIDDKKLGELNVKIGELLGFEKILGILQGFEDELMEGKQDLAANNSPKGR